MSVGEKTVVTCPKCGREYDKELICEAFYVCPDCGFHIRMRARQRIDFLVDKNSFEEWDADLIAENRINFPDYDKKLEQACLSSEEKDSAVCGTALVGGQKIALFVMDSNFMMGSMGSVTGEKITATFERATKAGLPVVGYTVSGGARMQEGIFSLMQMAKTSGAVKRHSDAGLLYLCVLTDPTTGGVTASFAMEADIAISEPGALIAFTGPRVIEQTIRKKLPEGFQRAEFLLEHGFLDAIVERKDQRDCIIKLLRLHDANGSKELGSVKDDNAEPGCVKAESGSVGIIYVENGNTEQGGTEQGGVKAGETEVGNTDTINLGYSPFIQSIMELEERDIALGKTWCRQNREGLRQAYDKVLAARAKNRRTTVDYIRQLVPDFMELHGDRRFGDDRAVIAGVGSLAGKSVTVIGIEKGKDLQEKALRNFGCAHPEGYRKALRQMKLAEKFGRPVICFVDTSGAYCGIGAEERGQGQAIAENLMEMMTLKVPIISIIIGEGGSGGALALGVANEVWMLQNAVYSVISPEGCASILWKDSSKVREASECLKLTSEDLYSFGIIDMVLQEDETLMRELFTTLETKLAMYCGMTGDELIQQRYQKYRKI